MYKFYKDKPENFECNVTIEGAPLSKSKARLVLENNEYNIIFEGNIDSSGKCIIPVKKLGILPEGLVGKLKLEVIVEDDTYFLPYESDFTVALSKKVTVEALQQSNDFNKKIVVEVKPAPVIKENIKKSNSIVTTADTKKSIKKLLHTNKFKSEIKEQILNRGIGDKNFYEDTNGFIKKLMISEIKKQIANKK